tara:strand:- start:290 stop:2065 length:1776 start_codon:yes stop_codon:yes gene_type:complete
LKIEFKNILRLFLLVAFTLSSCRKEIMRVKTSVRRTQSEFRVLDRTFNDVKNAVGVKNSNQEMASTDSTIYAPAKQKTLLNNYGYIYDFLNGNNELITSSNFSYDSIKKTYYIEDKKYLRIKENNEVFGWHPYWMGSSWKKYPFELLSTISYFSYKIDPNNGSYTNPEQINEWRTTSMIDSAKTKKTRVLLTVSCHGRSNNDKFLGDENKWITLIDSVTSLIKYRDADGIDLNFEGLPYFKRTEFNRFVKEIRESLDFNLNKKTFISVTLPALNSREIFDVREIQKYADLMVIMGYDYNNPIEYQAQGAVAPLQSVESNDISLKSTIDFYLNKGIEPSKTVLALPYYGSMWEGTINNSGVVESRAERKVTYSEIMNLMKNELVFNKTSVPIFDETSMTNYMNFVYSDNTTKEIWFDDDYTLGKKYDYALTNKLKGIGIWALGYDNGYDNLWKVIEDKFSTEKINFSDPIAEMEGYPINISKFIIKNKRVFVMSALFFSFSLVIGLIIVLSDWRIRESIVNDQILKLVFSLISLLLCIPLLVILREFVYSILNKLGIPPINISLFELMISFFLGLIAFYFISKITIPKTDKP